VIQRGSAITENRAAYAPRWTRRIIVMRRYDNREAAIKNRTYQLGGNVRDHRSQRM
jgi:hypothetical protein